MASFCVTPPAVSSASTDLTGEVRAIATAGEQKCVRRRQSAPGQLTVMALSNIGSLGGCACAMAPNAGGGSWVRPDSDSTAWVWVVEAKPPGGATGGRPASSPHKTTGGPSM